MQTTRFVLNQHPVHWDRFGLKICLTAFGLLAGNAAFAQQPPSTVFRSALLETSAASYSYSSAADLTSGGAVIGGVSVHHAELSLSGRRTLTPGLQLAYGLAYEVNLLDASAATPLPDQLAGLSLNFGLIHPVDARWNTAVFVRPGFYSDFKTLGVRSFNVPVLFTASYTPRRELTWTFAVSVNTFSKNTVLPVIGAHWQFAPDWDFEVGFPRTALTWRTGEMLKLRISAEFQGGSYRVTREPPAAVVPALAGSLLDYREIRTGGGLECRLSKTISLATDTGIVVDRRFDYHERNYRMDGRTAGYLKLSLNRRF